MNCTNCNIEFNRSNKKPNKSGNYFCSSSCSATYNNHFRIRSQESKDRVSKILKEKHQKGELISPTKGLFGELNPKFGKKYPTNKLLKLKKFSCVVCANEFFHKNEKATCSQQCLDSLKAQLLSKPRAKRHIVRTKPISLCVICGKTNNRYTNKTCSQQCKSILHKNTQSEYLKNPENRKKYKGNSGQSYMEASFEKWLTDNNILKGMHGYLTEVHFYNEKSNKHGWIDFLFPKLKIIIELDGTHHKNRIEIDNIRDEYLKSKGYVVIRIPIKEYIKRNRISEIKTLLNIS